MDVDAFSDVSNGSTISVGSATSGGSGRMPRPPSGGSKRSKSAQGRRSHIAKSPYSSQQFKQQLPPKPAARNMWITAMKNGNSSLSTENSPMRSWATSRPTQRKTNKVGAGRTRHVSDAVQIGDLKNKNHVRSASLSASEPQMTPGGVAYKPKEDYYDEIIELKKIINALKAENNIINTKLHRVEGENVLKDRKIEDLLNSRKQPEDTRRTLTDKKGDTSAIVNSLKQKLHALERTLKDKEAELSQLQRDLKMTNIEELQLQSETYYQEVQRLQLALIEMQQSQVREPFGNTTVRSHPTQKGKVAAHSLQKLTDENNHLRAENQGLKKDLLIAIENASTGGKKVPLKVEYADMNRGQLLYKIRDLEEKIQESDETKARTKKEFSPEDQQSKDQFRRRSISTGHEAAIVLKGTSSQKLAQLQEREAELLEEREKQRNVIERLKEDRTHYRAVADDLREKLKMAEEELERLREEKSPSNQRRQSNTSLSSVRRSSSTKEIPSAENKGGDLDQMLEEFQQQRAAKTLQRQWRGYKGRQVEENGRLLREQQNQAAATLQRNWRKHRHEVRRRESQEEAVTEIQAALRGHVVRCQRLEQLGGELEIADTEDAIVNIQSALRAHAARARHQENRGKKVTSRDSGGSHAHCINGPESVEDAGSNSSGLSIGKRDPGPTSSRQKRSSLTALQGLGACDKPVATLAGVAAATADHLALATAQRASPQFASVENATAVPVPAKPAAELLAPVRTAAHLAPAEIAIAQLAPAEITTAQLAPAEIATAQLAPVEIATAQLAPQGHMMEPIASKKLAETQLRPAQLAAAEHPLMLISHADLASTVHAQTDFLRNQSESDSDDDAVVIGRSARSKTGNRQLGMEQRERILLSSSKSHDINESNPHTESDGGKTKTRRGKQRVKKEDTKASLESRENHFTANPQESVDGSRRSLISAPRFSNISEQSDEDDVVMTSSSRTNQKARTEATGVLKVSNNNEKNQRKKKNTFEIADSDDDNDNDDDDVSVITPQRRSLDTGLNQPRPALSPSSRDMGPPSTVSRQETASLVSRSRGSLDTDQQSLEFSKDETMQRRGLSRSKRPVSAERPSLSRKDNTTKVLISSESASSGWARSSAVSEDDSDEDDVVITSQKTKGKPAAGDGKAVRPSLSRKLPTKKSPMSSQRESITTSLDNFFSSTGPSKGSSRNKSPRRSKGQLNESDVDDDDDDDDDEIVVSSRKNASSPAERKSSRGRKDSRDSVSSLWATSDKASNSSFKRKLSSENSSLSSSRNWGQDLQFERSSRRPESQLDELF